MAHTVQACGIYARISQDDGTALGVARQIEDCTAEAERRGWPIAEVFTDNDVSATKSKIRPEYERLLAAIESGSIDALIVYDVDRLTRTPTELERFIALADKRRTALASIGGEVDLATPQGRLTARIKGDVARHEVEQMSRRLKRKFQENAKDGKAHGVTPFGYVRERLTDDQGRDAGYREVIEPAQAEAIRELYRLLIAGESLRSLAAYLNDRGFKTGRGNAFAGNTVGNMLRRPRYAGHRTHAKQIVSKGQWEPIITQDTYDQAIAVLTAPGPAHLPRTGTQAPTVRDRLMWPVWDRAAPDHQQSPQTVLRLPWLHEAHTANGTGARGRERIHGSDAVATGRSRRYGR
ncbi:recombinase family protein [Arthrobacter sp. PAMC25284]|uniref:recombinase family protein n=1 Tax=Arthrobacter sp. PAMC25284 TaxID=2861279 RepID=UPI001C6284C6|nr:recombinase family protein [Arthrobacter sp. PAMC25284]QYF89702.1 recombinase family protein [Arthrobacter sp. PAMC25284]